MSDTEKAMTKEQYIAAQVAANQKSDAKNKPADESVAAFAAGEWDANQVNAKRMIDGKFPKGTLLRVGQTRGRNPQVISYEAFDESKPETLPADIAEFMTLLKLESNPESEKALLSYLIDGFNSASYTNASDPLAEFINAAWSEDRQKAFKPAVRAYATGAEVSLTEAAEMIQAAFNKAHAKESAKG